jgi:TfoX/Sxy family transcriptional regulator of competence genes
MHEGRWKKAPAELAERFREVVADLPAEQRQMFGYPAAFVNGYMFTGLHQDRWVVRLPEPDHAELLAQPGASPFEPMPGRPMKGFAVLPADVVAEPERARAWVERALAHASSLPPKQPRARTKAR